MMLIFIVSMILIDKDFDIHADSQHQYDSHRINKLELLVKLSSKI